MSEATRVHQGTYEVRRDAPYRNAGSAPGHRS